MLFLGFDANKQVIVIAKFVTSELKMMINSDHRIWPSPDDVFRPFVQLFLFVSIILPLHINMSINLIESTFVGKMKVE